MKQEEKQLLFKDLCARLPYGIVIHCTDSDADYDCFLTTDILHEIQNGHEHYNYKPYLRPMSSMTEEEKEEINTLLDIIGSPSNATDEIVRIIDCSHECIELIDFYLKYHFDYRGLIEKGLALEAPEGMYETKTE